MLIEEDSVRVRVSLRIRFMVPSSQVGDRLMVRVRVRIRSVHVRFRLMYGAQ